MFRRAFALKLCIGIGTGGSRGHCFARGRKPSIESLLKRAFLLKSFRVIMPIGNFMIASE